MRSKFSRCALRKPWMPDGDAGELQALGREVLGEHLGQAHVVVDDEKAMVGHGKNPLFRLQSAIDSRVGP